MNNINKIVFRDLKIEDEQINELNYNKSDLISFIKDLNKESEYELKDIILFCTKEGTTLVYSPKLFFKNLSKDELISAYLKIKQRLSGHKLEETTQASSIPHTPGSHLRIKDKKYELEQAKKMEMLRKFFNA